MSRRKQIVLLAPWLASAFIVCARQNPPPAPTNSTLTLTNAAIRTVEPGIFEIGRVRLDQRKRSITFEAELNRADVPMEYFLVTTYGKTHESILKTAAAPYDIHLAMLLLGADASSNTNFPGSPANGIPGPIVHPSAEAIPGNKVAIDVKWKTLAGVVQHPAEELVFKEDTKTVMAHGAWVYNGSMLVQGKFLSQVDGSIISLVTDPVALINNTGPGHDNDEIWLANTNNLPPPNVPVEVTIMIENRAQ
jgi:hypothetical protein